VASGVGHDSAAWVDAAGIAGCGDESFVGQFFAGWVVEGFIEG
jgi:hypothetical protein